MLPGGVYLVGGGAKLTDIVEVAKRSLRLPATLGVNKNIMTVIDKANDLAYLSALGLVAWGYHMIKSEGRGMGRKALSQAQDIFGSLAGKVKNIFKSLKPWCYLAIFGFLRSEKSEACAFL